MAFIVESFSNVMKRPNGVIEDENPKPKAETQAQQCD
ncbi:hypothetical protein CCACVL1_02296 [Corchorus capsularis]|uniref:Uncharacterized protein n=1 Tax=Corchorus capsularis TaxID=210143 RepID=A0A1R3K9D4_COCAP|nr:hypothetical protein CCACVL1_02296 [Corchorus capsularis]